MNTSHPGKVIARADYISKREQLSLPAMEEFYKDHNRMLYSEGDTIRKILNGHYVFVLAVSDIEIPATPENIEIFGACGEDSLECCMRLSAVYDLFNHVIIDAECDPYLYDTNAAVLEQTTIIPESIGADYPYLTIIDPIYDSLAILVELTNAKQNYILRLRENSFLEEKLSPIIQDDEDVVLSPSQYVQGVLTGHDATVLKTSDRLEIRVVRILDKGQSILLASNLPRDEFPKEVFRELYDVRWDSQGEFKRLMDRMQAISFTGTSYMMILQDIFAGIFISNIAEAIARESVYNQGLYDSDYRHLLKVHRSRIISILKDDLIYAMLLENSEESESVMNAIYAELSRNYLPAKTG